MAASRTSPPSTRRRDPGEESCTTPSTSAGSPMVASFRKDPDTGGRREEWRERRADLGLAKWPRENEDDTAPATVGFRISPVPHAILPSLEPVLDGLLKAELPR